MNKQELTNLVAEILAQMNENQPMVKGSDYKPSNPGPEAKDTHYREGDFVPDVTQLDLRKLYLTDHPENREDFFRQWLSDYRKVVLSEREKEFVTAAKSMGIRETAIAFKHILPNVISIILVNVTLDFAGCLLTESSLSYLGFGVQQPRPTWGNMLTGSNNSIVIQNYWWQWVFPSLFLSLAYGFTNGVFMVILVMYSKYLTRIFQLLSAKQWSSCMPT